MESSNRATLGDLFNLPHKKKDDIIEALRDQIESLEEEIKRLKEGKATSS